jgi:hypothetical protein
MSKTHQINRLQRLTVGQPTTLKASTWNDIVNHVESATNEDNQPIKSNDSQSIILCKNTSGAVIYSFRLVAITYPEFFNTDNHWERAYNATPTMDGREPTEQCLLGITQEKIENGEAGYVMLYGVTPLWEFYRVNAPSTMTNEKAHDWYLTPSFYFQENQFVYTNIPSQIRLLRMFNTENGSQTPALVYLDNGIRQPKPYFNTTFAKYQSQYISVTHDSFDCYIIDSENNKVIEKTVPSITYNRTGSTSAYSAMYLIYNAYSDTFTISSSLSPQGVTECFFCQIGYFSSWRFINTCQNKPVLYPIKSHIVDSTAFNLSYSPYSDTLEIYVSRGVALIAGTGICKEKSNTIIHTDSDGNNFEVGTSYYVYAIYDLSTDTLECKAYKKSTSVRPQYSVPNGHIYPSTTVSYALLGEVCYGIFKNQMFKGCYLPMFLNIDMRNPT